MILESEKSEFLRILNELKVKRANFCTQKEMAVYLNTSRRKFTDFENGKNFDFWLLSRYADILGKQLIFDLYCA